jgi:hypothetical protein
MNNLSSVADKWTRLKRFVLTLFSRLWPALRNFNPGGNLNNLSAVSGQRRRQISFVLICLLLGLFLFMPFRINSQGNVNLPILRTVDALSRDWFTETLTKVSAAWLLTVSVDGLLSIVEDVHIPIINTAPGKALSGLQDSLGQLSTVLLWLMGLLSLGLLLGSVLSFICFKVLLPAALFLELLQRISPRFRWARRLAFFLVKAAVFIWLFFPASALVNGYFQSAYLDVRYAEEMSALEAGKELLSSAGQQAAVQTTQIGTDEESDESSLFSGLMETARSLKDSVSSGLSGLKESIEKQIADLIQSVSRMLEGLLWVVIMFVLTVVIIPSGMFALFLVIFIKTLSWNKKLAL